MTEPNDWRTKMEARGWEFMPIGPDEWTWLKFRSDGSLLAKQGDTTWMVDNSECKR